MTQFSKETRLAIKLGKNACRIPEWFQKNGFQSFEKSDKTPVTLADIATQAYIINSLRMEFPEDNIIAEEEGTILDSKAEGLIVKCYRELGLEITNLKEIVNYRGSSSNRQWTIDPIDGTQGFVEGLSYAIGIGFMIDSIPSACAISVPSYEKNALALFFAEKGRGAHASYGEGDFTKITVTRKSDLKELVLCQSLHYDQPWVSEFAQKIGIQNSIKIDSMLKFCKVAEGSADLYIKPIDLEHSFSWDYMPGILIVEEAGGKVTDTQNQPIWVDNEHIRWTSPGIVASNGVIHENIMRELSTMPKV
ncbi:MAG: hypothetical protein JW891_16695 [Candidatus Lokiarchaeota archaeon]|nr:hypothetical protein [Candidatus Lokiarchaeota archaeon]